MYTPVRRIRPGRTNEIDNGTPVHDTNRARQWPVGVSVEKKFIKKKQKKTLKKTPSDALVYTFSRSTLTEIIHK